jgi:hypothetical protein
MNPNNNNLDYLLKLPTPRLLKVFRMVSGQLSVLHDWDWNAYEVHKKGLEGYPETAIIPKQVLNELGIYRPNPLYRASQVRDLIFLRDNLKAELDKREHVPR